MHKIICMILSFIFISGCSYHFRTSKSENPFPGVRSVYVPLAKNKSRGIGIEAPFTHTLIRELNSAGQWKVVERKSQADGIVIVEILDFDRLILSKTKAADLPGCDSLLPNNASCINELNPGGGDALIADQYSTEMTFQLSLFQLPKNNLVYQKKHTRTVTFPAHNRLGVGGSTNPLVNSSRERIAAEQVSNTVIAEAVTMMLQAF